MSVFSFCFVGLPSLECKLLKGTVRWTFFLKLPLLHPGPGPEQTHRYIFKEGDAFKEQEMMPSTPPSLRHLPHSPGHGLGSSTPTSSPASAPLPEVPRTNLPGPDRKPPLPQRLQPTLSTAFGSAFQHGCNISVVNTPHKVGGQEVGRRRLPSCSVEAAIFLPEATGFFPEAAAFL